MYNLNLLKNIDLESDKIFDLTNNINYCFSIFKKSQPETYVYLKGNKTFEMLYSLTPKDQGKCIHNIFDEKKQKLIHNLFEKYAYSDQYIQFIDDTIIDSVISIWDVYGVFKGLQLICMGIRRNSDEHFLFKNSMKYYEKIGDTLLLCKKESGFYVEDFSEGVYGLLNQNSDISGKLFVNLLSSSNQSDLLMQAIEQSLKQQVPVNQDIEMNNYALQSKLHFTVVPLILSKAVKILLHIQYAYQQEKTKIVNRECSFEESYQEGDFGICKIDTVSPNFCFLEKINFYLEKLFLIDNTNIDKILDSNIVKQCMSKKTAMNGRIMLKTEDGNLSEYQLQIIPTIGNHEVKNMQAVITPIIPQINNISNYNEENKDIKLGNSVSKMLEMTRREREMISLVLEGYTNKMISVMLTISEGTVKSTLHNAYQKLGIASRMELARLML